MQTEDKNNTEKQGTDDGGRRREIEADLVNRAGTFGLSRGRFFHFR